MARDGTVTQSRHQSDTPRNRQSHLRRSLFVLLGLCFFGVGLLGVFLPVLPTTPFMLLALWAFSRSSRRLHDYLWHHPRFGPAIRAWKTAGVIPRKAKLGALGVMSISAVLLVCFTPAPAWAMASALTIMAGSALWLWRRPESG
ncbi:MAG TPA: YbaN family protein [Thiolinea sp.]|nr:YbaN family protein [Thiolinea sp.]